MRRRAGVTAVVHGSPVMTVEERAALDAIVDAAVEKSERAIPECECWPGCDDD